jgi:predicted TPR repeat methyltransferase
MVQENHSEHSLAPEIAALERVTSASQQVTYKTTEIAAQLAQLDKNTVQQRFGALFRAPVDAIKDFLSKFENVADRNYLLAQEMFANGHYYDTIMRLKFALRLRPDYQEAYYLLGITYLTQGKTELAVGNLKKSLALNPAHEESSYALASLDAKYLPANVQPTRMPYSIVHGFFESTAEQYDVLQQKEAYAAHIYADDFIRRHIDDARVNYRVLDLGCGTGLMGGLLIDIALSITGVDFSRAMIHEAMQRKLPNGEPMYERAILRDIREYLQGLDAPQYDIVTMVCVANYLGDLTDVFKGVADALRDGGIWLVQVEFPPAPTGYGVVKKSGRFGHSESYMQNLADANGLTLVAAEDFKAFQDGLMRQYLFRKGTSPVDEE